MAVVRSLCVALAILPLVISTFARVHAQNETIDIVYRQTPARSAIEQLAKVLGKSVAFDIGFPNTPIDFTATVPRAQALQKLLQDSCLFSVEVAGVTIIARDSADVRDNYSAARVAACVIAGQKASRTDVVFRGTPVKFLLETLASLVDRTVGFDSAPPRVHLRSDVEIRNVTYEEALQITCLISHLSVADDGKHLEFSAAQVK